MTTMNHHFLTDISHSFAQNASNCLDPDPEWTTTDRHVNPTESGSNRNLSSFVNSDRDNSDHGSDSNAPNHSTVITDPGPNSNRSTSSTSQVSQPSTTTQSQLTTPWPNYKRKLDEYQQSSVINSDSSPDSNPKIPKILSAKLLSDFLPTVNKVSKNQSQTITRKRKSSFIPGVYFTRPPLPWNKEDQAYPVTMRCRGPPNKSIKVFNNFPAQNDYRVTVCPGIVLALFMGGVCGGMSCFSLRLWIRHRKMRVAKELEEYDNMMGKWEMERVLEDYEDIEGFEREMIEKGKKKGGFRAAGKGGPSDKGKSDLGGNGKGISMKGKKGPGKGK